MKKDLDFIAGHWNYFELEENPSSELSKSEVHQPLSDFFQQIR